MDPAWLALIASLGAALIAGGSGVLSAILSRRTRNELQQRLARALDEIVALRAEAAERDRKIAELEDRLG